MNLQQLREKRSELVSSMEQVVSSAESEGRYELDSEEQELYDSYAQELNQVKAAIERREALEAERADLETVSPAASRNHGIQSHPGHAAPEAKQDFSSLGEFMHAVRFNPSDQRLQFAEGVSVDAQGQRMDDGASGGYLIPQRFRDELLSVDPQDAIVRPRARVIGAGDPPDAAMTMPALDQTGDAPANRYGGVEVEWIGEGETKPATEAAFREITLQPHELAGHISVTDKFLRNWDAASAFLEQQLRSALIAAEDVAMLRGNGVAKPIGALEAGAAYSVNRDTASEVNYVDLVNMRARLHGAGVWVASQSIIPQLMQVTDPNGNIIWQPNARQDSPGSILGLPVVYNERSVQLGNRGDLALCDFSYYLVKDGSGPMVAMGYANDDFTRNRSRIKVFSNVDGKPWLTEPFKQESGYEVSPFVVLDDPSS